MKTKHQSYKCSSGNYDMNCNYSDYYIIFKGTIKPGNIKPSSMFFLINCPWNLDLHDNNNNNK